MADYHPLIARAVAGLQDRSPAMRVAIYERARAALIGQLRSLDPPLPESEIERERLNLEAAIARVEAEYEPAPAPVPMPPPAPPPRPVLGELPAGPVRAVRPPVPDRPARQPAAEFPPAPEPPANDVEEEETGLEPPVRPRIDAARPLAIRGGGGRSMVLGGILALAIALIAVAAFVLRDRPSDLPRPGPLAEAPAPGAEGRKLDERIGGPAAAPPAAAPSAPPAVQPQLAAMPVAVLYEEDPANPQIPKTATGRVTWRVEAVNAGQGQPLDSAIRAQVDIPEAGFALSMLIRRNLDATLPASHTIELAFTTRAGENGRVVRDVGLLQFKNDVTARGAPVAGLPVPVRDNLFLIGLSNLPNDIERNVDLLRSRNWIDLPIRTAGGQRAIVSFEKGAPGSQAVQEALQQWQAPPATAAP